MQAGQNVPSLDQGKVATLLVLGSNDKIGTGAIIALGDFGTKSKNTFWGEYGNTDSDQLWFQGKLGYYLTYGEQASSVVSYYDPAKNSNFVFNTNLRVNGVNITSDARMKDNIQPIENPIDVLSRVDGVSYTYRLSEVQKNRKSEENAFPETSETMANEVNEALTEKELRDEQIKKERAHYKELKDKFEEKIKEEKTKVVEAGGLKIIGTERHESRRIDNQLRGRSGRQGDPGESRFYIALDDDLMKIFGGDRIVKVYERLGADEDMPINSKMISNAVESAQKKVEGKNFSIRKHVLQYDDVMNSQREIIYAQRKQVLDGDNLKDNVLNMIDDSIERMVNGYVAENGIVNSESLIQDIETSFGIEDVATLKDENATAEDVINELKERTHEIYENKENEFGSENMRELERVVMLKVVDQKWMAHIDNMDHLKQGMGLRAYKQQDPIQAYQMEGSAMFDEMIQGIKTETVKLLYHVRAERPVEREKVAEETGASHGNDESVKNAPVKNENRVGRNDMCPCGSGKKYKNCCGREA